MILLFGPPGAGKSMQGQMLAARQGWKWLSTGEMLRRSNQTLSLTVFRGRRNRRHGWMITWRG